MNNELTKKERKLITMAVQNHIKHLDGLLEENIEKIFSEEKNLNLNNEAKKEGAIILAKEVYFKG